MTRLGFQHYLESGGVLSSATRKLCLRLKEQWLRHLQDFRLLAANLIVFSDWLESTTFIFEDLLDQTNGKFKTVRNQKLVLLHPMLTILRNQRIQNDRQHAIWICEKFKSMKLNELREHVQKFRLCLNCLRPGHRSEDCKSRTCSVPNCGRRHNKLLHSDFSKKEATTGASDATTAVATVMTQGGLP